MKQQNAIGDTPKPVRPDNETIPGEEWSREDRPEGGNSISIAPGEDTRTEWCEPVREDTVSKLK